MNVQIIFDIEENEYICFVAGSTITGFGRTETDAVRHFLVQCQSKPNFNQKVIAQLLLQFP